LVNLENDKPFNFAGMEIRFKFDLRVKLSI